MIAMTRTGDTAPAVGFTALLRIREFRLLWLADAQSLLGDQLARVALSVLVYDRTGSGLVTAAVYALTFLPALAGGVLLGPLADRLPRRGLLIGGDLIRAALLAAMALPALSVPVLATLLVAAVLVGTPWKAAESALVVDILTAEDYPRASAYAPSPGRPRKSSASRSAVSPSPPSVPAVPWPSTPPPS